MTVIAGYSPHVATIPSPIYTTVINNPLLKALSCIFQWSRAKLINKLLTEHYTHGPVWRTKQILLYIRLHGHYPIRTETIVNSEQQWPSWNNLDSESNIKDVYRNATDITSLTAFKFDIDRSLNDTVELSDDEEVDVTSDSVEVNVKKETVPVGLQVLPVDNDDDRLRFLFIERKCADIGIELRNEDVGSGYSYR